MKKRFNRYLTGILSIIIIISSVFPGRVLAEDISELPSVIIQAFLRKNSKPKKHLIIPIIQRATEILR